MGGKYSTRGFGIMNMQERVERLNGSLEIDSSPGNGTIILVEIPNYVSLKNDEKKYKNYSSRWS